MGTIIIHRCRKSKLNIEIFSQYKSGPRINPLGTPDKNKNLKYLEQDMALHNTPMLKGKNKNINN